MKKQRKKKAAKPAASKPEAEQKETAAAAKSTAPAKSVEKGRKKIASKKSRPAAVVLPEGEEPKMTRTPVPVLFVVIAGFLFYLAAMYLFANGPGLNPMVYYPNREVPASLETGPSGETIYKNYCAACHQPTGAGNKGLGFPPLAGSDWVNAEGPNRVIRIVLNGLSGPITVNDEEYNNNMLPWRDALNDEQIAAVLTFVRSSWGNGASAVTPEAVAAIRAETESRGRQWTAAELLKIPDSD